MPENRRDGRYLVLLGVLAVLLLLYSVLILGDLLAWVSILVPVLSLYLAWRFVRAHERIADALEADAGRAGSDE